MFFLLTVAILEIRPVLDLDFAATGDWFLSAAADRSVTCWKSLFVPRSLAATAAGSPGSKSPFVASTFSVATDGAGTTILR